MTILNSAHICLLLSRVLSCVPNNRFGEVKAQNIKFLQNYFPAHQFNFSVNVGKYV